MKETGIVRKLDNMGRVVLPKELRRWMEISEGTLMEILVDKDTVVLRKVEQGGMNQ